MYTTQQLTKQHIPVNQNTGPKFIQNDKVTIPMEYSTLRINYRSYKLLFPKAPPAQRIFFPLTLGYVKLTLHLYNASGGNL